MLLYCTQLDYVDIGSYVHKQMQCMNFFYVVGFRNLCSMNGLENILVIPYNERCRKPSFKFVTKAKACKGASQE
jgi:hypothetical protein